MTTSSRDAILQRIRSRLAAGSPSPPAPPVPEVWPPAETGAGPSATGSASAAGVLAERFAAELQAISGQTIRCPSMADARRQLAALMQSEPWAALGASDSPAARELTADLPPEQVRWVDAAWKPTDIAQLPAGLLVADALLADTGSCLISCATAPERLFCYLPPACVVLGRAGKLVPNLPAAWPEVVRRAADPSARGETVIVTGPSRTADIEKILILGVHGPKRLVVLLVG